MSEIRYNRSVIPEENRDFEFRHKQAYFKYDVNYKQFVKKGSIIGTFYNSKYLPTESFYVFSEIDGVVSYHVTAGVNVYKTVPRLVNFGDLLFEIIPLQDYYESHKPYYIITTDPYSGDKKIVWSRFYGFNISFWHSISFEYLNGAPQISLGFDPKILTIKAKDSISFLFLDGDVRTLKIDKAPIKLDNGHGKIVFLPLNESDLNKFCDSKLVSLRYNTEGNQKHYEVKIESCEDACGEAEIGQTLLQNYALEMKKALCEIGHKWVMIAEKTEECFVYLMEDTANGYHKIGISNHPEYREGTLQSEKPTIELVCAKRYPSRLIASAIESSLHKAFEDKRIRGEWFRLTPKDVSDIILTLR